MPSRRVANTASFQPRPVRQAEEPGPSSRKCSRSFRCGTRRTVKIITLSGGMKRRVLIAKALAHEPRVLFLDEPTAGVDVELRKAMWQVVRRPARFRRHHHPHHALHRGGRGDGRPHRRHQQGRDHPGRGERAELMRKLGKKQLTLQLQQRLDAVPAELSRLSASSSRTTAAS